MVYLFFFTLSTRFFNIFCLNAQFSRLGKNYSGWAHAQARPPLARPLLIRKIGNELMGDGRQILNIMKNFHLTRSPVE